MAKDNKKLLKTYALLHVAVLILSVSTVCSRFAAGREFMSFEFIALYGGVIFALGIYAIIWQQVLKNIPLTNAFVNKSATLVWSLIWGVTLFGENVSASTIIGILIVFCGVFLVVSNPKKKEEEKENE